MKRTTTVSIDSEIWEKAKDAGINISRFLEKSLEQGLMEALQMKKRMAETRQARENEENERERTSTEGVLRRARQKDPFERLGIF